MKPILMFFLFFVDSDANRDKSGNKGKDADDEQIHVLLQIVVVNIGI